MNTQQSATAATHAPTPAKRRAPRAKWAPFNAPAHARQRADEAAFERAMGAALIFAMSNPWPKTKAKKP